LVDAAIAQYFEEFLMSETSNEAADNVAPPDFQAIISDIAALKRDLAALVGHMKASAMSGPGEAAQHAIGQLSEELTRAYEAMAGQGEQSAKAIGRQIEDKPVVSLLLAFGLGLLGGRLLLR
jgi:hypothetical protein